MLKAIKAKDFSHFSNTLWMFPEHILKMGAGILLSVLIARELGPEGYGIYNYVIALIGIFVPIVQLGMSTILVRELVNTPKQRKSILSTSFYLLLCASLISFIFLNSVNFLFFKSEYIKRLILVCSIIFFFKPFDVIEYYFQSLSKAKYSSLAKTFSLLVSICLKVYLLYNNYPLNFFIYAYVLDFVFLALFLFLIYKFKGSTSFFVGFDISYVKSLFSSAWPLILSTLSIILYMRLDQLMIKSMLNATELGYYSSAVRLYEGYISVIFVITISLLPSMLKVKDQSELKYRNYLTLLFSIVFWVNTLLALFIFMFRNLLIEFLYGDEYTRASLVLGIVFFSSSFASMGSVSARYFIVEKMEKKMILRTWLSLVINIILNLILIPKYGIEGSAIATLISICVGNYFIDYFDKELKVLIKMKNNGIIFNLKKPT